jgi:DNA polymerase I-like protein with 3'-5' exonuclease and polymerase domains
MSILKNYITCKNIDEVKDLANKINTYTIISFDVESTGLNVRKDTIVGMSFGFEPGLSYYLPTYEWSVEKQELLPLFIDSYSNVKLARGLINKLIGKKLIMHNASYDTSIVLSNYGIDLLPSLHADTILLVHTTREEGSIGYGRPFALKSIGKLVQKYIDLDVDKEANEEQILMKESVKNNGGLITQSNFEIYKADLDILSKYACADTDLTLRIYLLFSKVLEKENLEDFFYNIEVMPLYKEVTVPMEREGILINFEKIKTAQADIIEDIKTLKEEVYSSLRESNEFKAWVYSIANKKYPPFKKEENKLIPSKGAILPELVKLAGMSDYFLNDKNEIKILKNKVLTLPDSEIKKYLLGDSFSEISISANLKKLLAFSSVNLWKKANDNELININSKQQLSSFVFDFLNEKPITYTDKGAAQFNESFVESISEKYDWSKKLTIYNKLNKLKSAYMDRFLDSCEDGRYYFYYQQHGTVSGRYSSDAQQLPRPFESDEGVDSRVYKYTNMIRTFFICDEGTTFIDCDYVSLEPHIFAHISGDEGLRDIFRKNWDFYSRIAIDTEKLSQYSADPEDSNFLKKANKTLRNKAKSYSLGIPYGMSAYALGKTIDVPTKEAKILIEGYLNAYPELKKWMVESEEFVKINGFIKCQSGRIRHLPKVKEYYSKFKDKLLDYDFRDSLKRDFSEKEILDMYRDYKNGLNNAKNIQIQSMAAHIVNKSALLVNREFIKKGIKGLVVAQIHDQLIFKVEEPRKEEALELVQNIMENSTKLSINLKAPPELSKNWQEGH